MRLLTKTTLYFFSAMIVLVVITGFYLFNQFSRQLNERSDKELMAEEAGWLDYLQTGVEDGTTFILRTGEVSVYPSAAPLNDFPLIQDVVSKNSFQYRQLSQVVSVSGITYQIIIRRSQEQKAALIEGFTKIMLLVFIALLLVAIFFNWIISRGLWVPFQRSLQKIRNTELHHLQATHFEKTNTREFNELNTALNIMTDRIYKDFINIKEFTENAAHEMQTPIAVVQSKLELLLQDHNLHENQLQSVTEAYGILSRLSKLNQGLLMLSKIENNQYPATALISLTAISRKYINLFDELVKDKHITVETDFATDCMVHLHPVLADSLVSNLIGNAIKYNFSGGSIYLTTGNDFYRISNTSQVQPVAADKIFTRFNSSANSVEGSNGLGLSIVKKIAGMNGLKLTYHAEDGMHTFELEKDKANGV